MNVRLRDPEEETELQHGGNGACAPRLDGQSNESVDHQPTALERARFLLDAVQLDGSSAYRNAQAGVG